MVTETELYRDAKAYQNGADMSERAQQAEEDYINDSKIKHDLQHVLWKLRLWPKRVDKWSDFIESLLRGTWQAKYGFYRPFHFDEEDFDSGN